MMSIHNFFVGVGLDDKGRTFQDYLQFTYEEMETIHDYIQWAFPTRHPSRFNPHAPLLTGPLLSALKADKVALDNYRLFLEKMVAWYLATNHWLVEIDHNHLRITRIIESVSAILGPKDAERFYITIMVRNIRAGSPINQQSVDYWDNALKLGGVSVPSVSIL